MNEQHPEEALPFLTPHLAGIGGTIKTTPEDFIVEEIPGYEPSGEGEHIYLRIKRKGWTTRDLSVKIAGLLNLPSSAIGSAGLKDRQATVTQTLSAYVPGREIENMTELLSSLENVELLSMERHANKLRTGHLKGNRFQIRVVDANENGLEKALVIREYLQENGFPNYYGVQRFGKDRDNALRGKEILLGKRREKGWLRKLLLSAYQSELFNRWLRKRIEAKLFSTLLLGDIARKSESGGLFRVEDLQAEAEAFATGRISYTGPMFGKKMRNPESEIPLRLEEEVLAEEGIEREQFAKAGLDGSRRPGRVIPEDFQIVEEESGSLLFSFTLPAGVYATSLMREIMKEETELNSGT